MKHTCCLV